MMNDLNTYVQEHNPLTVDLAPTKSSLHKDEKRYASITKDYPLKVIEPDSVRHGWGGEYGVS